MEADTKYGFFIVTETATGLMAEKFGTHSQYFIEGKWLPSPDCTMDYSLMVQAIESEYEFQNKL